MKDRLVDKYDCLAAAAEIAKAYASTHPNDEVTVRLLETSYRTMGKIIEEIRQEVKKQGI